MICVITLKISHFGYKLTNLRDLCEMTLIGSVLVLKKIESTRIEVELATLKISGAETWIRLRK